MAKKITKKERKKLDGPNLAVAKKLQTLEKIMEKAMKEALHTMDTEAKELSFFSSPEEVSEVRRVA